MPAWATFGQDIIGRFADITISGTEVIQRLRWIPPGQFRMGSPKNEPGRHRDEGPQHEVTLDRGFWMFDTPCTQALWVAVMGKNPSEFQTPTRPVECVSSDDAEAFIATLNDRIPGLSLSLPSEAQWEYACRSRTYLATYIGKIDILGINNAPLLDRIAWYAGNSGEGFDLDNGLDSSDWPEKQYSHSKAGTRPVALKAPNLWGLFDMLGNVQEWCLDHSYQSYDGAPADGSAWLGADAADIAGRVLRGGSWCVLARGLRAACRYAVDRSTRSPDIGFRCISTFCDAEAEK